MKPDQLKQLIDARTQFQELAVAETDGYVQRYAVLGLNRVHVALCDWGVPNQRPWYEALVIEPSHAPSCDDLANGLSCAVRGRSLHLGDVRKFWQAMAAQTASRRPEVKALVARHVAATAQLVDFFAKKPNVMPKFAPLAK